MSIFGSKEKHYAKGSIRLSKVFVVLGIKDEKLHGLSVVWDMNNVLDGIW